MAPGITSGITLLPISCLVCLGRGAKPMGYRTAKINKVLLQDHSAYLASLIAFRPETAYMDLKEHHMTEASNPADIVKLLYTYGPFALLVFFLFAGEAKARKALKEAIPEARLENMVIYGLTWAADFGLLVVAISAWYRINFPKEVSIAGQLQGLQGSETMFLETSSPDAALYLNKQYAGRSARFTDNWRLISQKRIPDAEELRITLEAGARDLPATVYLLKVRPEYYARRIVLEYEREKARLKLNCGVQQFEYVVGLPETESAAVRRVARNVGYAAEPRLDTRAITLALDS